MKFTTSGKVFWIALTAVLVAAALLFLMPRTRHAASEAAPKELTGRPTKVVAQAQVVPIDGIIEVRPLTDGRVLRVLVHPGDRVEAQQLLAEIESDIQIASVDQHEADVKAAAERAGLIKEGVRPEDRAGLEAAAEAARNETEMARDRWERQQRLREQGFVSEQSVLEMQRSYAAADARGREAQMRAQAGRVGGRPGEARRTRTGVGGERGAGGEQGPVVAHPYFGSGVRGGDDTQRESGRYHRRQRHLADVIQDRRSRARGSSHGSRRIDVGGHCPGTGGEIHVAGR
jgi:multidrug efflux pump subunit AcrA (membrane-fusion protein)